MSSNVDQVWCDVGGTFTDCFVVRPDGQRLFTKVLSSGVVKGSVEHWLDETTFVDTARRTDPIGFWIGAQVRWLDDAGVVVASQVCIAFDRSEGVFSLQSSAVDSRRPRDLAKFVLYELVSGLEAPVLATRLLLGCKLSDPLPALDVRLGTTRGTNALLTRSGEPCGFVVTKGFADLLRIGYQERPDLFALNVRKRTPLHHCVVEIEERLAADGAVIQPIGREEVERSLRELFQTGIRSIAICLLHSYLNPEHELIVEEIAKQVGFTCVCISCHVSPKIKAVLRSETALVDAYLTPIVRGYLARVSNEFGLDQNRQMRIMTSSGGLVAANLYRGKDSVLSGPAGGAIAIEAFANALNEPRCIGLDMGGTSTDVCRIDGKLQVEHETIKAGVRMLVPTLAIHTVAAGGGSICWFDGVSLRVGPQSAGADPGPACYGRGGPLTITDLNLLSDRIDAETFPFPLGIEAAKQKLNAALFQLNSLADNRQKQLTPVQLIEGFRRIANESMAAAVRSISIAQGADPRQHALVGFGGAAGQHLCEIADLLGMTHVIDPPQAGLLSALGIGMASIKRTLFRPIYRSIETITVSEIARLQADLSQLASIELSCEGIDLNQVVGSFEVELRYAGADGTIMVSLKDMRELAEDHFSAACTKQFNDLHRKRYGYASPGKSIEIVLIKGEFISHSDNHRFKIESVDAPCSPAKPHRFSSCGIFLRDDLLLGQSVAGPALIVSNGSTTSIPILWNANVLSDRTLSIRRSTEKLDSSIQYEQEHHEQDHRAELVDPVLREVIAQRIAAIAEQMGIVLGQTAMSVNVKDRRDFSCAVFASNGDLIANAPHVPVHLGAMSQTIRCLCQRFATMEPGDCFVTNDPYQGGSHLPDITVVTPVFSDSKCENGRPEFFVACRAHHAEIGGVSPGSMSPTSARLGEEGVVIPPMHLVQRGVDRSMEVEKLLRNSKYPSRSVMENMADLSAQQAANQCGVSALNELSKLYGLELVTRYLEYIQQASEAKTRLWIRSLPSSLFCFSDMMDDGTRISVQLNKSSDSQDRPILRIDFEGTGPKSKGNLNANPAIVTAAVMYVIRCAVADSLPLNSGVLRCIELSIPEGILNPNCVGDRDDWPAVAGGNVETSQRIVDCLLGAMGLAAASQGTMNNFLFGDSGFGYYETIGGGTGATEDADGEDAVHSHMTNTRLTDVEVLEKRYPVRLIRFEIRKDSGGSGRKSGGNGLIRQVLALRRLEVSLITSRRNSAPFGLRGGKEGKLGENWLICRDGKRVRLGSSVQLSIEAGDSILIETPGGGGMGGVPVH